MIADKLNRPLNTVTDEIVDFLNTITEEEPSVGELLVENFFSYSHVVNNTNYSIAQYLSAVKFSSCVLMNMTNYDAYVSTYPERYERLAKKYSHLEPSEIKDKVSVHVHAVAKSKLVLTILSQVQIPTKILNLGLLQEAINTEAELMRGARSEMVREKAASTLITYLGVEDTHKVELEVGFKKGAIVEEYEAALIKLVSDQKALIEKGGDVKAIANVKIVDVVVEESK